MKNKAELEIEPSKRKKSKGNQDAAVISNTSCSTYTKISAMRFNTVTRSGLIYNQENKSNGVSSEECRIESIILDKS